MHEHIPECREMRVIDTASSLTYRDYLHNPDGSAYGIRQKIGQFNVVGRLPLSNLYACGQSAILPGVMGAMMSAFFVCRNIMAAKHLPNLWPTNHAYQPCSHHRYGVVTPIGYSVAEMMQSLETGACATKTMPPSWNRFGKLQCQVGAPIELRDPKAIPRAQRRTMSPMSIMAVQASQQALAHAGIDPASIPSDPALRLHHGLHYRLAHRHLPDV